MPDADLETLLEEFRPEWAPETRESEARPVYPFPEWLTLVSPRWNWTWPHLRLIQEKLEQVTTGDLKRLMIFCPPRHGKSEQTTIRYPVWRLETNPETRVCVGCYNQRFSEKFGRRSRQLAERRGVLSRDRKAAMEWETPEGGVYRSCGVGSPPTGEGFDLVIIDDPIKSREEADSEAYQERAWEWYQDIYTRREPGCAIVLIQTRWHQEDLAGKLLAAQAEGGDTWEVVNLPALAEENDPLGRAEGEALCPERFDAAELEKTKAVLRAYAFSALYQQRPVPKEGGFFKYAWFQQRLHAIPTGCSWVRYWDTAGTEGGGDYTAGVLIGRMPDDRYLIADVVRGQWSPFHRDEEIRATAERDRERYGQVAIWLEQEAGVGGEERSRATIRALAGFSARSENPGSKGSKEARADPLAAQAGAGNVLLLENGAYVPWIKPLLDELTSFPNGTHDDQVDAASGAFAKLSTRRVIRFL